jgi:hypothetical protein
VSEDQRWLVVLDPLAGDRARELASAATGWLLEQGLVVPDGQAFAPGPAAAGAVEDGSGSDWVDWAPVEVQVGRDVFWAGEAFEGPPCPRCATPLDDDVFTTALSAWGEGGAEPELTCDGCGFRARSGDWPLLHAAAVGDLAVSFTNWPPLAPDRAQALQRVLGARAVWVQGHF